MKKTRRKALPAATTVIHLHGSSFSRKQVRRLIKQIEKEQRDGGRVVVT